ncbi:hypothetical protein BDV10DRAFT_186693 [Aspergillus recurvatus]
MPSVEWSRVNQTDHSPYDQVFILSEKWIANAHVGVPQISIHVEERNPAYLVLFTLSFDSGRIHLRTSPPGAPSIFGNFPLAGWKLVFKTRIDVGAGAGFDPSKSSYGETTLPHDTLDNLKLFVNEWLTSADERTHNWVGTFAPAVIDYAPYPWLDPLRPTVETDGLPQNALGILTYTDRNRRRGYGGLSHSGAFTDGGAAFCMNRDLFWNHYLLPILNQIN